MVNLIAALTISDQIVPICSQVLPSGSFIADMAWNPDGKILATCIVKPQEKSLCLFYDNCKNIVITDIAVSGNGIAWANNEMLYVQSGDNILEVKINNRDFAIGSTVTKSKENRCYLVGSIDEKVVYFSGNDIYYGDVLLYNSEHKINQILVDGNYVVFKAGDNVSVLDSEGNLVNKRNIEGDTTKLIALSAAHKSLYLVKNRRSILRYSFINDDRLSVVYESKP
jgi:hypothetical protein